MKGQVAIAKGTKYAHGTPDLKELENVDLFPEKTARAKEIFKQAGLPKELRKRHI